MINERVVREQLEAALLGLAGECDCVVDSFGTAAQAIDILTEKTYDLVVLDAIVFPGMGCADEMLAGIASMLPTSQSPTILRWQAGLRLLERMRDDVSVNRKTPVVLRFPAAVVGSGFLSGDVVTRESVADDLQGKGPVVPLFGPRMDEYAEAVVAAARRVKGESQAT